jgi:hypothetical protein
MHFQIQGKNGHWTFKENRINNMRFECMAVDPHNLNRIYAGTFDVGLWISDDAGDHWRPVSAGIKHTRVTAVAVSPTEPKSGYGILWVGTEPSRLYRSEDGGET